MTEPPIPIACPFCASLDTELFSLFGQQLLTVQYYCNACRTPFERVKGDDVIEDARRKVERELPTSGAGNESSRGIPEAGGKEAERD